MRTAVVEERHRPTVQPRFSLLVAGPSDRRSLRPLSRCGCLKASVRLGRSASSGAGAEEWTGVTRYIALTGHGARARARRRRSHLLGARLASTFMVP